MRVLKNKPEQVVREWLEKQGYEVTKRGWPDFIATRGDEVRLIEVKPHSGRKLAAKQRLVADALSRFGLKVELMSPDKLG